jgi:hypothetical protein
MKLEIPNNPAGKTKICNFCAYWLFEKATKRVMVMGPRGIEAVDLSAMVKLGQPIPGGAPEALMSVCTLDPDWIETPQHHWCGGWKAKIELAKTEGSS